MSDYWQWLEDSFVDHLRAQPWYNDDPPRYLAGYLNDKSNRLVGWATMRQLRVRTQPCADTRLLSDCAQDYSRFNEDRSFYLPGWLQETNATGSDWNASSSSLAKAFEYRSSDDLDGYMYIGNHATYSGGGYVYEMRGSLSQMRANLSLLHQLQWIDNQTRAVFIQLTLYNPNAQLFTAVTLLAEFLSTGGVFTSARFEPIQIYGMFTHRLSLYREFTNPCLPCSIHLAPAADLHDHLHDFCGVLSHRRDSIADETEEAVFS